MAVITNYNIKQVTNYDISKDSPTIVHTIDIPKRSSIKDASGHYPISMVRTNVNYKIAIDNVQILKLGYCCENKGIVYPIYLNVNGSYKQIQVGKNGMYEMQPETWKDINDTSAEEKTSNIIITGVQVPENINFTLEYVVSIN